MKCHKYTCICDILYYIQKKGSVLIFSKSPVLKSYAFIIGNTIIFLYYAI